MNQNFQISELACKTECAKICDTVLSELPDWFGPFDIYKDYMDDLMTRPVFVARTGDENLGILVLTKTSDAATVSKH